MKRTKLMLTAIGMLFAMAVSAQGDYLVKTTARTNQTQTDDEKQFVEESFPYYSICDLRAGQKFLLVIEDKYGFLPILKSAENNRDVSNSNVQYKVLEFLGTEETQRETYSGVLTSTRFLFDVEGAKYYHEVKNKSLGEICGSNPRALIHNLVFLGDVDVARDLLMGKTLYTKITKAGVDDENGGSREVTIPLNLEVTVTAIGAGTRECPVKIVFEDREGNTYFRNVLFSRTNSGLQPNDLTGANINKYFPNVFSFTDKEMKTTENIRAKYIGRAVYPKHTIEAKKDGGAVEPLLRYTSLTIKDVAASASSTMATLKLADKKGSTYSVEVNLKYDIFIRNSDYIDDMFGYGDLRKQHPGISEENWLLLGNGEVRAGMTKAECTLALGSPIRMVAKQNSRYETWYYQGRTIEFEEGRITRL